MAETKVNWGQKKGALTYCNDQICVTIKVEEIPDCSVLALWRTQTRCRSVDQEESLALLDLCGPLNCDKTNS